MSEYDIKDIKTLNGIEAIRLRPGMYIASVDEAGIRHIALETISNAVDEYLNGACTKIDVSIENNKIQVADNGRGIPFDDTKEGREKFIAIFTKLHTGAKFDSAGKAGYNTSGGQNGVGIKATNALSSFFHVSSFRNGLNASAFFEKGKLTEFTITETDIKETGTVVEFIPDDTIFKDGVSFDIKPLRQQLQELAFLCPKLIFTLNSSEGIETISSKNGVLDYLDYMSKDKEVLTSKFFAESKQDRIGVKLALQYINAYTDTYKLYTNNIPNSGGTHLTGFRTAFTSAVNTYARNKNLLKEKDENLSSEDLKEGLVLVLSLTMPDPVFSGQTKDVLTSSEGRTIVQRLCTVEFEKWLNANDKDAKAIIGKALLARTARDKARKAKEEIRNQVEKKKKVLKFASKLADCNSTKRKECEIYITEGDSATGGLKMGRNEKFQAVMPVRGKILNCQKATLEQIQKNAEIMTMIEAFGLTLDLKTMRVTYKPEELRYGKIIIMSDADVDGSHIKNLFYTFIWNFCPQLIKDGYIYAGVPPLYKITEGNGKSYKYLKDDAALEEYRKTHTGKKYAVNRMKGYE